MSGVPAEVYVTEARYRVLQENIKRVCDLICFFENDQTQPFGDTRNVEALHTLLSSLLGEADSICLASQLKDH